MAESVQPAASAAQPSFWEDLIDIYVSPADVFRRRQNKSMWPAMLFVSLSIGVIFFFTFTTLSPLFEAEFARGAAKQMAKNNPQMTPEMIARAGEISGMVAKYGISAIILLTMLLIGIVGWLLGRLVGSEQKFGAAFVVAGWAYMPRVLGAVLGGVQGLLMDPAALTGQLAISIGPARFFDVETTHPLLYQLLGRFDLITLWVTVLLAIGLYVTGKVSKTRAVVFGILIWLVGGLPAVQAAIVAM